MIFWKSGPWVTLLFEQLLISHFGHGRNWSSDRRQYALKCIGRQNSSAVSRFTVSTTANAILFQAPIVIYSIISVEKDKLSCRKNAETVKEITARFGNSPNAGPKFWRSED